MIADFLTLAGFGISLTGALPRLPAEDFGRARYADLAGGGVFALGKACLAALRVAFLDMILSCHPSWSSYAFFSAMACTISPLVTMPTSLCACVTGSRLTLRSAMSVAASCTEASGEIVITSLLMISLTLDP